jgi:hypothetical protein
MSLTTGEAQRASYSALRSAQTEFGQTQFEEQQPFLDRTKFGLL